MKIAVIGAGPAGISAAYQLSKKRLDLQVFEADYSVGGLSRSIRLWNQTVDLGPHRFFSSDPRVNRLWLEVVGRDYKMVDRLTRIYYKGRFFNYPLKPINALLNIGLVEAVRCTLSYGAKQMRRGEVSRQNETFEEWVMNRFGRRLYELFFRTYSEKLWGIPCSELDADFARQRIKKFSLGEAIKGALGGGSQRHKTLVDRFAYPVGGTGMVYSRMAAEVEENGGKLYLGTPIAGITHDRFRVTGIELANGSRVACDHVVSTMPLTLLVKSLKGAPRQVREATEALTFRNTILVYLRVEEKNVFPDQWLYVHSPELRVGRITNFRNWVPELHGNSGDSVLALEYWCDSRDRFWSRSDEALIQLAANEVEKTGLLERDSITAGHVIRIPHSYPVYRRGYKEHLAVITEYLKEFDSLTPIGRYGSFKYNNQDHSILMGMLAAENIMDGHNHNLWDVNTDYETYQEEAVITETGLARRDAA